MRGLKRVATYCDAICEPWIGWRVPPVQRAFEEAAWVADEPGTYCGRCGSSTGAGEAVASGCATCRGKPALADGVIRLGRYRGELRDWVLNVKYGCWAAMGDALGVRLGAAIRKAGIVNEELAVVVPMPMPWQRRLYRGIDHAGVIAAGVARELDVPLVKCLTRRNGPPMVTLTATERVARGGRDLSIRRRLGGWPMQGLEAIIVDDVRTTGVSMRAAARQVRSMKVRRVVAALVAVADDSARRAVPAEPAEMRHKMATAPLDGGV